MEGHRPQAPHPEKKRWTWRQYLIAVVVVLLLILIFQNLQKVEIHFFFSSTQTPLIFALVIAAVLGALIGWLLPKVRRSRKGEFVDKQD